MIESNESIRETFTRDRWSLHVRFRTVAELRLDDLDVSGDTICDRDLFIIELVRRIAQYNQDVGATILTVDRILNSSDVHFIHVSYDSFDFISDLAAWLIQYTAFADLRVAYNGPLSAR